MDEQQILEDGAQKIKAYADGWSNAKHDWNYLDIVQILRDTSQSIIDVRVKKILSQP